MESSDAKKFAMNPVSREEPQRIQAREKWPLGVILQAVYEASTHRKKLAPRRKRLGERCYNTRESGRDEEGAPAIGLQDKRAVREPHFAWNENGVDKSKDNSGRQVSEVISWASVFAEEESSQKGEIFHSHLPAH